jgi:chemotaxis methyl-accepting protein methylase
MNEAVTQAGRFRHVVFPDSVGGYGRAVDAAPRRPGPPEPFPHRPHGAVFPEPLTPDAESFLRWLLARAGLRFEDYKPETLARRLTACLRAVRAASPAHARTLVRRSPETCSAALDALLIGVTGFFRDDSVFDSLARRTLPNLLDRRSRDGRTRPLRVWSAGCSDGAELYTVAILLAESGALSAGRVELLGTDCRPDAVARAAAGAFDPQALRAVPARLVERYFEPDGPRYRVRPALRAATTWRLGNALAGRAPDPGVWDLVLCRNLAIYLQPDAASGLWASLAAALRPGGVLVLGKAERPLGLSELAPEGPCAWRRAGGD